MVLWLGEDRKKNISDYLDRKELEVVNKFIANKKKPYKEDKSLIYRKYAQSFMYNKMYVKAILVSFIATTKEPFKSINYRTLLYCTRKAILNYL